MATNHLDPEAGRIAWRKWQENQATNPSALKREDAQMAVLHTLNILEQRIPGRSVEVRVIPFGAVQVLEGATHRRGTPPAVVEMDADTWLALAAGLISWESAEEEGLLDASGERSDLSAYLPL